MAEVLYYNPIDLDKYDKFKKIAEEKGIDIIEVGKDHLDEKIGYLLGISGFDDSHEPRIEEDCDLNFDFVLFNGFDNQELFDFLDELRNNGASVQHKAGITDNNVKWTLRELLIENDKEAKTMGLVHKINQLIDKAEGLKSLHGEDRKVQRIIDEILAYFNDSSIFEIEIAKKHYLSLLDEVLRFEKEHQ